MSKIIVSMYLVDAGSTNASYIDDRGDSRQVNTKAAVPAPLINASTQQLENLYAAGGALISSIGANVLTTGLTGVPCSDTDNLRPRRLVVIFSNGSETRVPVRNRSNLISVANSVISTANNAAENASVACLALEGERILDLSIELGGSFNGTPINTDNYANYYSGTRSYQIDGGDVTVQQPIRLGSPFENSPPGEISGSWGDCVGELQRNVGGCGSNSTRFDPRKYIPEYLGGNPNAPDEPNFSVTHEVPVVNRASSDIQDCGESVASDLSGSLLCLSYRGHSDGRFDKLPGVNL